MQQSTFLNMLKKYFNESELEEICFALTVDYDELPGKNKTDKARELISYLERRNRVPELLKICQELRPQVSWSEKFEAETNIHILSDAALELLYASGKELEKAGLLYEAAAKYWKIEQAQSNYRDVSLRLAVVEELHKRVFVGREEELAILMQLLEKTMLGVASVVFLSGEAGIGKTSLAYKFFRTAQAKYDQLAYAVSSCSAQSGFGEPYLPFKEIITLLCGEIESQIAQANVSITNAKRLAQIAPRSIKLIPQVAPNIIDILVPASLFSVKEEQYGGQDKNGLYRLNGLESPISAFSNSVRTAIIFECSLFLRELTYDYPLIIFIDDLQWGDSASIDLLCYLATKLRDRPIMFVGAFRPEDLTLAKESLENCINELKIDFSQTTKINLDETEEAFVPQYVNSQYPNNQFPPELVAQLQSHTSGNALFVSELFHLFKETRRITQDTHGAWKFRGKFSIKSIPARVETVIEKRINSLTEELRRILEAASVEGEEFTAQILAQLQGVKERDLVVKLSEELEKRWHLVTLSHSTTHQRQRLYIYRFKHALIRTYLYHSLPAVERELLHRDIGLFLESLYETQLEKISPALAEHFWKAELPAKEITYRMVAAKEAAKIGAWEAAIYHLNHIEERLNNELIVPQIQTEIVIQLLKLRGNLYALIPDSDKALNDFRQLERIANTSNDNCLLAYAFCGHGILERSLGNFGKAIDYVHRIEEIVSESDCHEVAADYRLLAAKANKDLGQYDEVIVWAEKAQAIYEQNNNLRGILDSSSQIAYAHYAHGHYDQAESIWESNLLKAPEYANAPLDPDDDLYFCLGFLNWRLHKYEKAKTFLSTALESARRTNNKRKQAYCLNNLGFVETSLGNYAQAESILKEALDVFRELGDKKGESWALGNLGNVLLQVNRFEEAISFLIKNREFAEEIDLRSDAAESSRRLSEAYLRSGNLPRAYHFAQLGLQEAESLGRRAFASMIYRILGQIAAAAALQPEMNLADINDPEHYFKKSVEIVIDTENDTENKAEAALSLKAWGEYLIGTGNQEKGRALIVQAESLDVEK